MGNLLKVMQWHIEKIQALPARFVALAVFSALAKSNLKNKGAGRSIKLPYFDSDLIENLDDVSIRINDIFLTSREGENDHLLDLQACWPIIKQ